MEEPIKKVLDLTLERPLSEDERAILLNAIEFLDKSFNKLLEKARELEKQLAEK